MSSIENTAKDVLKYPRRCYYCSKGPFPTADAYERHIVINHPLKPGYPSSGDIERLGLKYQETENERILSDIEAAKVFNQYVPLKERITRYTKNRPSSKFWMDDDTEEKDV